RTECARHEVSLPFDRLRAVSKVEPSNGRTIRVAGYGFILISSQDSVSKEGTHPDGCPSGQSEGRAFCNNRK
ncbi:MAG: hypothetical protein KAW16_05920, partial [candidate division Zixibacteria bacterium]|nr:hypothetical protein [candidate division Zixibacteria bacterium]